MDNTINTRIQLKVDTLSNWILPENQFILLDGEVAIAKVDVVAPENKLLQPVMVKVGDGAHTFNGLDWISAKAADVYDWAKAANKPQYMAEEIVNIVGKITSDGGEIFNSYTNNFALSPRSHAEGVNAIAGGRGFKILAANNNGDGTGTYTLSSVDGLVSDGSMYYSVRLASAKYRAGVITAINENTITVSNYPNIALQANDVTNPETSTVENYLTIVGRPELGDISVGFNAHVEGENTMAQDRDGHAEGRGTKAIGQYGHAEGRNTVAAYAAHAEGRDSVALGDMSHVENYKTTAIGDYSHAEGYETLAQGQTSHAEGHMTKANAYGTHTEGNQTVANEAYAHAEGEYSQANNVGAHAEGFGTIAQGKYSHAEGLNTLASGDYQHVQGAFNESSFDMAHIIGGGTSEDDRKNIHTIDWDGNAWFAGNITIGADNKSVATADLSNIKAEVFRQKAEQAGVSGAVKSVNGKVGEVEISAEDLNTYTKDEINSKISSVYKFKGTQVPFNLNNIENVEVGDVYNMLDSGTIPTESQMHMVSVVEITDEFIYLEGEVPNAKAILSTYGVTRTIEAPYLNGMATIQAKGDNIVRVFGIVGDTSILTPAIGQTWPLTFTAEAVDVLAGDNVAKLPLGWDKLAGTVELEDLASIATSGDIYDISNPGAVHTDANGEKYIIFNCGTSTTVI